MHILHIYITTIRCQDSCDHANSEDLDERNITAESETATFIIYSVLIPNSNLVFG